MITQERKRTRADQDDYLDGLDFAAKIVADEIDRIATFTGAGYPGEGRAPALVGPDATPWFPAATPPTERGPRHIHVTIPARMVNAYRYARGVAWWKR